MSRARGRSSLGDPDRGRYRELTGYLPGPIRQFRQFQCSKERWAAVRQDDAATRAACHSGIHLVAAKFQTLCEMSRITGDVVVARRSSDIRDHEEPTRLNIVAGDHMPEAVALMHRNLASVIDDYVKRPCTSLKVQAVEVVVGILIANVHRNSCGMRTKFRLPFLSARAIKLHDV